mmetsp:Transcript_5523/g.13342  ORF Transcript_5523/g.13342 Transcript_5523/m.13342 type:complete len:248 (+) Transcript_5523:1701-2444(+)
MPAAQVGGLHGRVVAQMGGRSVHRDAAVLQHIAIVGHLQRRGGELLDQQHGHAPRLQAFDDAEDLVDQDGRQAHGRFVEQHHLGVEHHRAGHGQHLLLTAGQRAGQLQAPLLQAGKQLQRPLQVAGDVALGPLAGVARKGAQAQVVGDGHRREHAPAFRRVGQAAAGDVIALKAVDAAVVQRDLAAGGLDHAADGPHGGGLAGAIGADQGHDLPLGHLQRDAVQDLDLAVAGAEVLDAEHDQAPPPR